MLFVEPKFSMQSTFHVEDIGTEKKCFNMLPLLFRFAKISDRKVGDILTIWLTLILVQHFPFLRFFSKILYFLSLLLYSEFRAVRLIQSKLKIEISYGNRKSMEDFHHIHFDFGGSSDFMIWKQHVAECG